MLYNINFQYINSEKVAHNTSKIYKTKTQTISYTISSNGQYLWSINCTDSMSRENNSITRTLTIKRPSTPPASGHGSSSGAGSKGGTGSQITNIEQTEHGMIYTIPSLITPIELKPITPTQYISSIIIHPARETSDVKISIQDKEPPGCPD